MLIRTHLAITLFFVLILFNSVEYKLIFVVASFAATFIPDIDSRFSTIGRKKIARVLQWLTKHRGMIHSFTFLFVITFLMISFVPIIALGFFLGYGLHLFADSFTSEGIKPFYPSEKKSKGKIITSGKLEMIIFVSFLIADLVLILGKIF